MTKGKARTITDYADRLYEENERLRAENSDLRSRLNAVHARCLANNWTGTAKLCGEVDHGSPCGSPRR